MLSLSVGDIMMVVFPETLACIISVASCVFVLLSASNSESDVAGNIVENASMSENAIKILCAISCSVLLYLSVINLQC